MFIDEVTVELEAGNGGNGCMAFRREKYIEMGGPYGGNGGMGASIIFEVDEGLNTLVDLRYKRIIKAPKGENGLGKGKQGASAKNVIIKVPAGTVITDVDTDLVIADLTEKEDSAIVVKGGRGGRGNIALATKSNPAPSYCENGEPGEIKKVKLELKLLADVGLVGMPSVGKSTIISKISASKPKIAPYHFTTLVPNLGVVRVSENKSFVVADLPGLIEGASLGEGLGEKFLKHIERTRVIAHVIDMSGIEGRDPYEDYIIINKELNNFNPQILEKKQIIIANKMDMEKAKENLKIFKEKVKNVEIFEISALNNQGLTPVINKLYEIIEAIPKKNLYTKEKMESYVLYKFEEDEPFKIYRDNNTWVITGERVEKILKMTKFNTDESALRFANKLKRLGVDAELRKMGAKDGDNVRILDFEFDYKE